MPPLPKKNKKKEADFGLWLRTYDQKNNLDAGDYELKQTETDSIPFSCIEPLQVDSALRTESKKGNLVRIQKGTIGAADYRKLRENPAYVVIRFPGCVYFIRIKDFIEARDSSDRKSLTSFIAKTIAEKVIPI